VVGPANGDEFQSEVRKDKERKRKSKRAKEPKIPPARAPEHTSLGVRARHLHQGTGRARHARAQGSTM